MDNTTMEDWVAAKSPFLNNLLKEGSIGILNHQTGSNTTRSSGFMTMSSAAGSSSAGSTMLTALDANEAYEGSSARQVYKRRIGDPGDNQVLVVGLSSLLIKGKVTPLDFTPGNLGQSLSNGGYKTAVLGNSDISMDYEKDESLFREAAVVGMKENGTVDYGLVGKDLLKKDGNAPFGIRTNENLLLAKTKEMMKKADFLVIDYGDTTRADFYGAYAVSGKSYRMRYSAIRRGADFLRKLEPEILANNATLIVASSLPPGSSLKTVKSDKDQLTPILFSGKGWESKYLISTGTRRKGLVSNFDIAPTILGIFGVKPPFTMLGRSLKTINDPETDPQYLISFNKDNLLLNQTRPTAIVIFIYFQFIIFLACSLFLVYKEKIKKKTNKILRILLLSVLAFPIVSFIISKLTPTMQTPYLISLIFVSSIAVASLFELTFYNDIFMPSIIVLGATISILSVDVVFGSFLELGTVLGYDPIRGSRFFGVGNESMSILIAAALLFFALVSERFNIKRKWLFSVPLFLMLAFLIGFPGLGTNTDGATTAVTAFGVALLQLSDGGLRKNWYIIAISVVVFLSAFVGYDVLRGSNSHFGRSFQLISHGGFKEVLIIIRRKLGMNLTILRYSKWSYFLLATFGLIGMIRVKPMGLFKTILNKYKTLALSVTAGIAGGVVGFAFNDSGIVIPAIMLSYFMAVILTLMLAERAEA